MARHRDHPGRGHPTAGARAAAALCLLAPACTFVTAVEAPSAKHEILASGDWQHASGAVFPERIEDFHRGPITALSSDGRSVSVAYFLGDDATMVQANVDVYPRGHDGLRDQFEKVIQQLQQYYPGAQVENAELEAPPGSSPAAPQVGARCTFATRLGDRNQDVASYALLGGTSEWWVLVRATVPAALERRAMLPFSAFLARLPSPGSAAADTGTSAQGSR